jgi:hypothetical protein
MSDHSFIILFATMMAQYTNSDVIKLIGAHVLEGFFPVAGYMEANLQSDVCNPIILEKWNAPGVRLYDLDDEPHAVWIQRKHEGRLNYDAIQKLHENHLRVLRSFFALASTCKEFRSIFMSIMDATMHRILYYGRDAMSSVSKWIKFYAPLARPGPQEYHRLAIIGICKRGKNMADQIIKLRGVREVKYAPRVFYLKTARSRKLVRGSELNLSHEMPAFRVYNGAKWVKRSGADMSSAVQRALWILEDCHQREMQMRALIK